MLCYNGKKRSEWRWIHESGGLGFDLVEHRAGMRVIVLPHPEKMAGAFAQHPHLRMGGL